MSATLGSAEMSMFCGGADVAGVVAGNAGAGEASAGAVAATAGSCVAGGSAVATPAIPGATAGSVAAGTTAVGDVLAATGAATAGCAATGAAAAETAGAAAGAVSPRCAGDSHSSQASTPRFTASTPAITHAQIGMRRRGAAMRTSISTGPDCRWRSDSDFFSASRMNDMASSRYRGTEQG